MVVWPLPSVAVMVSVAVEMEAGPVGDPLPPGCVIGPTTLVVVQE